MSRSRSARGEIVGIAGVSATASGSLVEVLLPASAEAESG